MDRSFESRLDRRTFLGHAATAAAGVLGGLPLGGCRPAPQAPNVLFILADQWRFCALGDGRDGGPATPAVLDLAASGARFTRAYASNPVCAPSRASILTGRHAHQHRVIANGLTLPPEEIGMVEAFRAAGYATHYVGKWHLDGPDQPGFVPPGWRRHGFETFEGFNRGHRYARSRTFSNDGRALRPEELEYVYQTDRVLEFARAQRDRAFFCFLSWGPPHQPWGLSPVRDSERFANRAPPWRPNVPTGMRARESLSAHLALYYDLCEALDRELSKLLAGLDGLGLGEDTIVVFTSDHGDMIGSHALLAKSHPFDESLRVPLVMRWPGRIPAGSRVTTPTSGVDLLPTLQRLCGLEPPPGCSGSDRSPEALGERGSGSRSIYASGRMDAVQSREWRALVTQRHKLVVTRPWRAARLYDLEFDPFELRNLVRDPGHAALKATLLEQARSWKEATRDPFPDDCPRAQERYSEKEAQEALARHPA